MMDLTVVIPAYNAADVIGDQLSALSAQHVEGGWEVVVVDNCSTDGTGKLAQAFSGRLPVRVIDARGRRSRAAACNAGVAASSGRALVFVDADDVVGPGYIEVMRAALELHDFVAGRLDCAPLNPGWIRHVRSPAQCTGLGDGLFPYGYGGTLGVRRDAFERVGGFDEGFTTAEDIDFCYRMGLAGIRLVFVPEAVLQYRFRTSLSETWRQAYSYGIGSARIYDRYKAHGEKSHRVMGDLRIGGGLARNIVTSRNKASVGRALYFAGNRLGYVRGRLQMRGAGEAVPVAALGSPDA